MIRAQSSQNIFLHLHFLILLAFKSFNGKYINIKEVELSFFIVKEYCRLSFSLIFDVHSHNNYLLFIVMFEGQCGSIGDDTFWVPAVPKATLPRWHTKEDVRHISLSFIAGLEKRWKGSTQSSPIHHYENSW